MKTIKAITSDDQTISLPKEYLHHLGVKDGENLNIDLSTTSSITLLSDMHREPQTIAELFSETEDIVSTGDSETVQALKAIREI